MPSGAQIVFGVGAPLRRVFSAPSSGYVFKLNLAKIRPAQENFLKLKTKCFLHPKFTQSYFGKVKSEIVE